MPKKNQQDPAIGLVAFEASHELLELPMLPMSLAHISPRPLFQFLIFSLLLWLLLWENIISGKSALHAASTV
jgi:hypothetical protein